MDATSYGYEIDFLPVGNGERSGDAIAIRYGVSPHYKVMVVDGGTKDSGQALVEHIQRYYHTTYVDYLVNTHPDADHASGLEIVLEQLTVGEVWVHRPWEYASEILHRFNDQRITNESLAVRFKDQLSYPYRLEEIAQKKGVPVYEPFAGSRIGDFLVLSPTIDWYLELIPQFNKTPEAKVPGLDMAYSSTSTQSRLIAEHWDLETLPEEGFTSGENESSVILYGNLGGKGILLTGDAGTQALTRASNYAAALGLDLSTSRFVQVPHHGSRRNINPRILNRILGPKVARGSHPNKTAFVSSSKTSKSHPRKVVVNAFIRRGCNLHATQGQSKCHYNNMPEREGWSASAPLSFFNQVEDHSA